VSLGAHRKQSEINRRDADESAESLRETVAELSELSARAGRSCHWTKTCSAVHEFEFGTKPPF
jgi:hypothetical protein